MERRHSISDIGSFRLQKEGGWNTTQEKLVASWGEKAKGYRWMHNKTSKSYNYWFNTLGIWTIILSAMSSSGQVVNTQFNNSYAAITTILFSLVAGIFSSILKFKKLEEEAAQHRSAEGQYQAYISNIEYQLSFKRGDRQKAAEYVNWARVEFNRIIGSAPQIPERVANKFLKRFGDSDVSKPDVANGINHIQIGSNNVGTDLKEMPLIEGIQEEFEERLRKKHHEDEIKRKDYEAQRYNESP